MSYFGLVLQFTWNCLKSKFPSIMLCTAPPSLSSVTRSSASFTSAARWRTWERRGEEGTLVGKGERKRLVGIGERRRWNSNEQTGPVEHDHYTSWYLSVPERKFFLCFWTVVELQPVISILYLPSLSTGCSWDPPHAGTRRTISVE